MRDLAIRVENLGKQYKIGAVRYRHDTLRDELVGRLKTLFGFNGHSAPTIGPPRSASVECDFIWAIKGLTFEVERGEVVGIIGPNGAGKSTLLKILSRITAPTSGYAEMQGRVGSLLEVGTGFHPELTGRENIYLNGAILGMKKTEIDRKFDEIVAFAETEKFLETPLKHYSSGMYVRLAFAVAAHLEPEILIVDEVLAVGDVQFQKKCLGKMQDIAKGQGRTVLFVSHSMDAIQRLCSKCLLFRGGALIANGDTASTVAHYLSGNSRRSRPNEWIDVSQLDRTGTGEARFVAVQYSSLNAAVAFQAYSNGPLEFLLDIASDSLRSIGSIAVTLYSLSGIKLVNADTVSLGRPITLRKGRNFVRLRIEKLYLNPDVYVVGLWLANPVAATRTGGEFDHVQSVFEIEVVKLGPQSVGMRPHSDGVVTSPFHLLEVT